MMVSYCEICNMAEQERPKTVFLKKKKTNQTKKTPNHTEFWSSFAFTKISGFKSQ